MISRLGKLQTTRNLVWSKVFIPLDIQISKINSSIYCYYLWTEIVLCMPLSKAKQMNTYCLSKFTKTKSIVYLLYDLRIIYLYIII